MKLWIIGKKGMLAKAFQRVCDQKKIAYIATSKEEANITDLEMSPDDCTHVINCSGYTNVDGAESDPEGAYSLNVQGVKNLICLARQKGLKLVHFSTDYVFDGKKNAPYLEEDVCVPLSVYGKTKREGEVLLEDFSNSLLIRTSWLFGRDGNNFAKTMLKLMREKKELQVVADQRGRPTFAEDLAEVTLKLLPYSGTFHFANHGVVSWYEWAQCISDMAREKGHPITCEKIFPLTTEAFGREATRPLYSVLATQKIENLLNLKLNHWSEGLQKILC